LLVRIDLPGRKINENDIEGEYFTFIDRDAVDALVKYFEERRGWLKEVTATLCQVTKNGYTR